MDSRFAFSMNKTLREDVNALGTFLVDNGFKGKNVAIMGGDPYSWILAYLSIVFSGATAVPLDGDLELHLLKRLANAGDCSCIFFSEAFEDVVWNLDNDGVTDLQTFISMDGQQTGHMYLPLEEAKRAGQDRIDSGSRSFLDIQIRREDPAFIQFESETADLPKPALMTHDNIEELLSSLKEIVDAEERGIFFSPLPMNPFMARIYCLLSAIYHGVGTSFGGIVSQIAALNRGTTGQSDGTVGRALPGIEVKISEPHPETGIGEILFRGPSVTPGYYDKPDFGTGKYPSPITDGWYRTGHRGRMDENLYIHNLTEGR